MLAGVGQGKASGEQDGSVTLMSAMYARTAAHRMPGVGHRGLSHSTWGTHTNCRVSWRCKTSSCDVGYAEWGSGHRLTSASWGRLSLPSAEVEKKRMSTRTSSLPKLVATNQTDVSSDTKSQLTKLMSALGGRLSLPSSEAAIKLMSALRGKIKLTKLMIGDLGWRLVSAIRRRLSLPASSSRWSCLAS